MSTPREAPWAQVDGHPRRAWRELVTSHDVTTGIISGTIAGLITGALVSGATIYAQDRIDDQREIEASRRDNLRYIREVSAEGRNEKISFYGIDLTGQHLGPLDLRNMNLATAQLSHTDLVGADLSGETTNLIAANLAGADLTATHLVGASFARANMTGAKLGGSNITTTKLNGADLTGADLSGMLNFRSTDFTWANLTSADLSRSDLSGSILFATRLDGANLTETVFPWDNPQGAPEGTYVCASEETVWPEGDRHVAFVKDSKDSACTENPYSPPPPADPATSLSHTTPKL